MFNKFKRIFLNNYIPIINMTCFKDLIADFMRKNIIF